MSALLSAVGFIALIGIGLAVLSMINESLFSSKRPHKFADARIEFSTQIPADRIAEISRDVAESLGHARGPRARFEGADVGRTLFSVRDSKGRQEYMTFCIQIRDEGTGSRGQSSIDEYKTTQQNYLGVPIEPRQMAGYEGYKSYLSEFGAAIKNEDPGAQVTITDLN